MTEAIDFPAGVLPYAVFSIDNGPPRLGVGIGTDIVDLESAARLLSHAVDPSLLAAGRLNPLLAEGHATWSALRSALVERTSSGELDEFRVAQTEATLHLAWDIADYVDFYSSLNHAENVGRIFRPDAEPLFPNWRHLPVAYHGRSGTVFVDGTPIHRPAGQRRDDDGQIVLGPSQKLDFEAELGWVVGGATLPGETVPTSRAEQHIFGLVILNDWSARDLQAWEYRPLGPFLGKSFATSVSAWVVPLEALSAARPNPNQTDPVPLDYLTVQEPWAFDIDIQVWLTPTGSHEPVEVARVNAAEALYWNAAQQLAHMTINGATIRPGDLFGTGTISGPHPHQRGSLLELSWNGTEPIEVGGASRVFLEDGDQVRITARVPGHQGHFPLGPVTGRISE